MLLYKAEVVILMHARAGLLVAWQRSSELSGASSTVAPEDQGGSTKERRQSRNNRRKSRVGLSQSMSIKRRVFGGGASVAHDDSDDEFDFESELNPVRGEWSGAVRGR